MAEPDRLVLCRRTTTQLIGTQLTGRSTGDPLAIRATASSAGGGLLDRSARGTVMSTIEAEFVVVGGGSGGAVVAGRLKALAAFRAAS